jgi:hypothetical protein
VSDVDPGEVLVEPVDPIGERVDLVERDERIDEHRVPLAVDQCGAHRRPHRLIAGSLRRRSPHRSHRRDVDVQTEGVRCGHGLRGSFRFVAGSGDQIKMMSIILSQDDACNLESQGRPRATLRNRRRTVITQTCGGLCRCEARTGPRVDLRVVGDCRFGFWGSGHRSSSRIRMIRVILR